MKLENVKVGLNVKVKKNPVYGSKAYATSLGKIATVYAIDYEDSEKDVRVLCDGGGWNWLNHADIKMIDKLEKPLSVDTIKVGMKVRTLEGTLTDESRFPTGSKFTVTSIHSDGLFVDMSYKRTDGTVGTQSDRIENLTKSW